MTISFFLFQLKNLIIGSKRCKIAFYHVGILDILSNLFQEYSPSIHLPILIQILDCISSFAKSDNKNLINRLIELGFIEQIFLLLNLQLDCKDFYQSSLRCLRSFFLPKIFSNPYLTPIPFLLISAENDYQITSTYLSQSNTNEKYSPVNILFDNSQSLPNLQRLLAVSKSTQISILEILCSACVNNDRQNQIVAKDFIPIVLHILVENSFLRKTKLI